MVTYGLIEGFGGKWVWEINLYFGGCLSIKGMFDKQNFEIISYIGTKKESHW